MLEDDACLNVRSFGRTVYLIACLGLALVLFGVGSAFAASPKLPSVHTLTSGVQGSASIVDTVPGSNTIVDLRYVDSEVWAATGRGASRYRESSGNWETFTVDDGLGADEIAALHKVPGATQAWVATSHTEVIQTQAVPFSDGIYLSTDDGLTWLKRTPEDEERTGAGRVCYDITSFRGAVVAARFYGGLVITSDLGHTWTNLFASSADQADFEGETFDRESNRYFSAAVDTLSSSSVQLYAGSAAGVKKYTFHDPRPAGSDFQTLEIIDDGIYAGPEAGLSIRPENEFVWHNVSTLDDLPTDLIGAVGANGDAVLIGVDSVAGDIGAGLAFSNDAGDTWDTLLPLQTLGSDSRASSIVFAAGAWWVACEGGGLIRSDDDGETWVPAWPDTDLVTTFPSSPPEGANHFNVLLPIAAGDTTILLAGTNDGIMRFIVPDGGPPVRGSHHSVGELSPQGLGQRITDLELQETFDEELIVWTLNEAMSPNDERTDGFAVSADSGQTWVLSDVNYAVRDVAFAGDAFWLLTNRDLLRGNYPLIDADTIFAVPAVVQLIVDGAIGDSLRTVETIVTGNGDNQELESIWLGTDSGLAFFPDYRSQWGVVPPNGDFTRPDEISSSAFTVDTLGERAPGSIGGNFVTALEVQRTGGRSIIWAGTQTTGSPQTNSISRSENGGATWTVPVEGHRVWNFAFDGEAVWAASSEGLLYSANGVDDWKVMSFIVDTVSIDTVEFGAEGDSVIVHTDTLTTLVDEASGAYIDWRTEIFAVEVVGDEVWVGTNNGLAILDRDEFNVRKIVRTYTADSSDAPIAFPSPYSPNFYPNGLRFRFTPPVDGAATISIYDFANQLVREMRIPGSGIRAGERYTTSMTWDGYNGKGDRVAIGAYFFVIEYSDGSTDWGKFAVIH
jgi:hypothetical protein